MAHFAKLGVNGKVIAVHGLDNDQMLNADNKEDETVGQQRLQQIHGWPAQMWIQTSYNTRGGIHYEPNSDTPSSDQSKALRKNFAGTNWIYDEDKDMFSPPQPYPSWIIDDSTGFWTAPTPQPDDVNKYDWNESTKSWIQIG